VSRFYDLNHLGGFLLLTAIAVHFTGEPGDVLPLEIALYSHFILCAIHPRPEGRGLSHNLRVNLVQQGLAFIRDGGSFTLTSGLLNDEPIRQGTSASLVNGALEGFVRAAAIELPRALRINLVSPTVIEESLPIYAPFFRGIKAVAASEAALGYVRSVEGAHTGRVYRIGWSRDN